MSASALKLLEEWYRSHCDGDWEHGYGVEIGTLDNPGWCVKIDLNDTDLEDREFPLHEDNLDHETDWLKCWRGDDCFHAACGPERLEDALSVFLRWARRGS